MKNFLIIFLIVFSSVELQAQENKLMIQKCDPPSDYQTKKEDLIKDENYIYSLVRKKAQPIEGFDVFFKNLSVNIKEELGNKIKRPLTLKYIVIKIRFVVEKDGTLTNMTILEDKMNLANDVFNIIRMKPKWKPAELDDKIVRMRFNLPIKIKLD